MANSPEASLKEAVRKLTMAEEYLHPIMEARKEEFKKLGIETEDAVFEILYEKVTQARDLITDALNWDKPER